MDHLKSATVDSREKVCGATTGGLEHCTSPIVNLIQCELARGQPGSTAPQTPNGRPVAG